MRKCLNNPQRGGLLKIELRNTKLKIIFTKKNDVVFVIIFNSYITHDKA